MATGGIKVHVYGDYNDKDIKKAIRDLQSLQTHSGAVASPMQNLGKAALAAGAAFASMATVRAVVDWLQDAAKAAMEDEKSVVALATAMDNLGLAHSNAGVEKFIKDMMLATGVADDQLRPAYQKLVTATGDVTRSQDLLQLSMDISAATGRDLASVSQALARASMGTFTALTRLGIPLDANIVKSKDFAAAQAVLNERFGGQAAAAAETYAGKLARIQAAAGEAQETIGYALLGALDQTAESMGGAGGFIPIMELGSQVIADMITGVGMLAAELGKFASSGATATTSGNDLGDTISGLGQTAMTVTNFIPGLGQVIQILAATGMGMAKMGQESRMAAEQMDALRESAAANDVTLPRVSRALMANAQAAADAEEAVEALKDSYAAFDRAMAASANRDELYYFLQELDKTLEGNARSFRLSARGAEENRDALRTALGQAAQIAKDWGAETGASAQEIQDKYKELRKGIIKDFMDQGFTRKEIKKFLGEEGIWTGPAKDAVDAAKTAGVERAPQAGRAVGSTFSSGIAAGIQRNEWAVIRAAIAAVQAAEAAARDEAESQSPSELFARVGDDLARGLADGMNRSRDVVVTASGALIAAGGKESQRIVRENIDAYMSLIEQAYAAMAQVADSITGQVMGNVSLDQMFASDGSFDPAATVNALFGSIQDQASMVNTVASTIGVALPPALLNQILAMPPDAAIALANYLAANPEMLEQLRNMYNQLALFTQDVLSEPMGAAWATVGGKSAAALIDEAKAYLLAHAKEFRRWVRENITATVTVTVDYVVGNQPSFGGARAAGGPVSPGSTYLVGEKGPELLTMGASGGFVTPNDQIKSVAAGNTYSINVSAGVGDPRQIGQQVVEYIKRYESANGRVFAAA